MGADSKIQWTTHTFNPWIGCTKVTAACANCYAEEQMDTRYGRVKWGPQGTRSKTSDANWKQPLKWNREAEAAGERRRVFCASLADVFEDWQGPILDSKGVRLRNCENVFMPDGLSEFDGWQFATMGDLRRNLFHLIDATPHLDWLLLTKRPENIREMWQANADSINSFHNYRRENVWLLTSVGSQADADKMVPELLKCRELVPVLGLSCEPLLGPVDLRKYLVSKRGYFASVDSIECLGKTYHKKAGLDWVIVGGESGAGARECDIEWIRDIRNQCHDAAVPCFIKQLGYNPFMSGSGGERFDWPCGYTVKGGNTWIETKDKKGGNWDEWPEDLRVREFPEVAT